MHNYYIYMYIYIYIVSPCKGVLDYVASKPGLLPQFCTQLRAPTIKCVGGKTDGEGLDDFRT